MSMMEQARQEGWGVPIYDATTEASWNEFMGGDVRASPLTLQDTIQKRPEDRAGLRHRPGEGAGLHHGPWRRRDHRRDLRRSYLNAFPRAAIEKTLGVYKDTVFLKDNLISRTPTTA